MNGKKVGVMQPYIFPYIGYFQLVQAVDTFVFYDDVDYIKGGWINRNRILVNGKENMFTVPLASASSNKKINETLINTKLYDRWRIKFMRTLDQAYAKAPYFTETRTIIDEVLTRGENQDIAELAKTSVNEVLTYLQIEKNIVWSSTVYSNSHLRAQERVIDICKKEQATCYINAKGGKDLYSPDDFESAKVDLRFIEPSVESYEQLKANSFLPGLSIIDLLMHLSPDQILNTINNAGIVTKAEIE